MTIQKKYVDLRWKFADKITSDLNSAGINVDSEHVQIWRPELVRAADVWATRERMVREGKHHVRLACPSFLYRLYVPADRQDEVMKRGRNRPETVPVCTRTKRSYA